MIELTPTDLRQYDFCPRVVFYDRCTPFARLETPKMTYGKEAHDLVELLEKRRSLTRYGLHQGRRDFRVRLFSKELGLSGTSDLVVVTTDAAYPIEFKNTTQQPRRGHHLQMCAYALLIEAHYSLPCPKGFWHSIITGHTYPIDFIPALRKATLKAIHTIHDFVAAERCPPPTPNRHKCEDCELRNFCGDVF